MRYPITTFGYDNNYMSREQILKQIAELKAAKAEAKGTKCEVYSRVVGYLRPVQSWNKGKQEEFGMRKHYEHSCGCGI